MDSTKKIRSDAPPENAGGETDNGRLRGQGLAVVAAALPLVLMLATSWLGHLIGIQTTFRLPFQGQGVEGAVIIAVSIITAALLIGYFLVADSSNSTRRQLLLREGQLLENADAYREAAREAREILEDSVGETRRVGPPVARAQ